MVHQLSEAKCRLNEFLSLSLDNALEKLQFSTSLKKVNKKAAYLVNAMLVIVAAAVWQAVTDIITAT